MKRILVIGGVHGNEPLGLKLVRLLKTRQITGVDSIVANQPAVYKNARYIETDLNRSFGAENPESSEEKLALKLTKLVKNYDVVLDFHNTQAVNNDCSFIGPSADKRLLSVSGSLGLNNCIEASYDCINKYCKNVLSIEISLDSRLNDAEFWSEKIQSLSRNISEVPKLNINLYRYQSRVTWKQKTECSIKNWKPFTPISQEDKLMLGVDGIITPIFIGSKLTEYYATLVSKERVE